MNTKEIVEKLGRQYPGRAIIKLPEENPKEIICEVEPTGEHPHFSIPVAVIEKSKLHYHRDSIETYEVLIGRVALEEDDKETILEPGTQHIIKPGVIHSARGEEAWVGVISQPGWTPEDHILVEDEG